MDYRRIKMIDRQRIKEEFIQLVGFNSVSFEERETANWIIEQLRKLGFEVEEDQAGDIYNGTCGNIFGYLKGSLPGPPILLSAHMDVVQPGRNKTAVFHDNGTITSGGTTVLGADDICGIIQILSGIRYLQEHQIAHRDVEVLFSIGEELYGAGVREFQHSKIKASEAYVFDLSGKVGVAAIQAPSILSFEIIIHGMASHAGFEPEKGVHSIALMGDFLHELKQGHVDEESTLNIGTISGGEATNIVPAVCKCSGEVRSYHHESALRYIEDLRILLDNIVKPQGGTYELQYETHIKAYRIDEDSPVVRRFKKACDKLHLEGTTTKTFGGSDNNHFVNWGIAGVVLSCGMYQVHSVNEYTTMEDLENGTLLVAELLKSSK